MRLLVHRLNPVRALLFDFNGVLVDDEPVHCDLLRELLADEGVSLSREAYYGEYLGYDDAGVLERAFAASGRPLTATDLNRLVAKKAAVYRDRMARDGYPFFPGAADTLRWALERYPLAVVSGALRSEIEAALDELGLRSAVAAIVAAEDAASKPDPEGYRLGLAALRHAGDPTLPPDAVVAIEDSPAGIRAAREAGLRVIGIAQTYERGRLGEAHHVIDGVGDLPGLLEGGMR